MNLRSILLTGLATVTLTACGAKPAPDLYVLRAPASDAPRACIFTHSIALDRPSAPSEYDSKRIAVLLEHNHLSYYTGASWASPFPDQLQDFLSDSLAARGVHIADASASDATPLHFTIREANITNLDAPIIHLRLSGTIGSKHFNVNESIPASENHMPQIVDAYDTAATHAADTILKSMKSRCPAIPAGD